VGEESERLELTIGIIADTHGVLHPRVGDVFRDVDHIIHAGDAGGEHILRALNELAPVTFVRGNNDDADGEEIVRRTVGGLRILLTHILPRPHTPALRVIDSLRRSPADVVIFGHSHLPHDELIGGVRFFNPASAGPRRFDYPVSVGLAERRRGRWRFRHLPLDERSAVALEKRMNQLV
jgi:putative phosphoesterase